MRAILLSVAAIAAATGCSKKGGGDKCQRVIDKSWKVLGEMAALRDKRLGDADKKQLVEQCTRALKSGKPDPQMECVLAASDDAGVRACYIKGYEDYLARSKQIEAKLQLGKIGKRAKLAFAEKSEFPTGKIGPTPPTPCCDEQVKQCLPNETMWADPVWRALEFDVEGAFHFQYAYESDGKTFTATATGDPGCTGKPTTITITGKPGADGNVEITGL